MIGDWVYVPHSGSATHYGQVKAIYESCVSVYLGNDSWAGGAEALKPVPLTPEILEKNGFVETDVVVVGTRKMIWESEDSRTEITIWMDDTMPMDIRKNIYYEDEVCYTLPFACTVHDLQHALLLCNISKEIVLHE